MLSSWLTRFRTSFTAKLAIAILLLSLVPLLVTIGVVVRLSVDALRADAYEMVQLMRNAAAGKSSAFLDERLNDVESWSRSPLLQDSGFSPDLQSRLFRELRGLNPAYRWIALRDATGRVLASSGEDATWSSVAGVRQASKRGPVLSEIIWHAQGPVIAITTPVQRTDNTLVAVIELGVIQDVFRSIRLRGSGETYLVSGDGRLISESRFHATAPIGAIIDTEGRRAASAGRTGVAEYRDYRGVAVVGAYAPFRLSRNGEMKQGWVILSELDVNEAMAPVHRIGQLIATFTVGLVLVVVGLIVFTTRHISRPLLALDAAAHELANGHLDQRVSATTEDEFGRVGVSFNQMADRLERQVDSLQTMTAKLQELDRFKNEYIHAISHDLRSPITVIHGYVEMLEDSLTEPNDGVQRDYTHHIERATVRLQTMVEDLLDTARLEEGAFHLTLSAVDLREMLEGLVHDFGPAASEAGIRLVTDFPDTPLMVDLDVDRIHRVLTNLLSNALKFTPAGGEVRLQATQRADGIECRVTDTGPGIGPEDLPRLFKRFSQLESGRHKKGSTGLGLSISKAIVEAHGGTIGVESTPGRGSSLWFKLPSAPPQAG